MRTKSKILLSVFSALVMIFYALVLMQQTALAVGTSVETQQLLNGNFDTDTETTTSNKFIQLEIGDDYTLIGELSMENNKPVEVKWDSSDNSVVVVDNGVVTALMKGMASVTMYSADDDSLVATWVVSVAGKAEAEQAEDNDDKNNINEIDSNDKDFENEELLILAIADTMATDRGVLPFNTNVSGSITTSNIANRYTVVMALPGRLSVSITRDNITTGLPDLGADVQWFDFNGVQIAGSVNGFSFPYSHTMDLTIGTYYIEIIQRPGGIGTNTGTYSIRADYDTDEIEPNSTIETAQLVTSCQSIRGAINPQGDVDIYKYVLSEPGRLLINLTRDTLPSYSVSLQWLNDAGTRIGGSASSISSYNSYMDLGAGTYFVRIDGLSGSSNTGTYSLRGDFFPAENNEIEPNNTFETSQLLTSEQTVTGFLSYQDNIDMYWYELTEPGRLSLSVTRGTMPSYSFVVRWFSFDGVQINTSGNGVSSYSNYMDLEAGTYFISISRYTITDTGTYYLRGDFTSAGNNEVEPNNTRATAQLLTSGQTVPGFISYQDSIDMYQYVLTEPGRLSLNVTRGTMPSYSFVVRWFDIDGVQINASGNGVSSYSNYTDLEAGTYFISVSRYAITDTGTYSLRGDFAPAENNEIEPNNTLETAQHITSGQTVSGFISYQDSNDTYRYVLSQPGRLSMSIFRDSMPSSEVNVQFFNSGGTKIGESTSWFSFSYSHYMDLEAGIYYIRINGRYTSSTGTYNMTVWDSLGSTPSIALNPTINKAFPSAITGYGTPTAHSVTVLNTSSQATGALTVALSGSNVTSFTLSATSINSIAVGGSSSFTVRPNTGLSPGTYNATVTISGGSIASRSFNVSFTVVPAIFDISINPGTDHTFPTATIGYGAQAPRDIVIRNEGNQPTGALTVALSGSNASSFSLNATTVGTIAVGGSNSFTVRPNIGLAIGTYSATVTVSGGNGISRSFNVNFTVATVAPLLSASPTTLNFGSQPAGYIQQPEQTITITNIGSQNITLNALPVFTSWNLVQGVNWTTEMIPGAIRTFTIRPNNGLSVGTYSPTFSITGSGGASVQIQPTFIVTTAEAPIISASPTFPSFGTHTVGYMQQPEQTITITNSGTQTSTLNALPSIENWTLIQGANWATAIAPGATRTFTIRPNNGLAVGTYNPTIVITGSGSVSSQIQPKFTVTPATTVLTVKPSKTTASIGEEITFTIEMGNVTNMGPFSFDITIPEGMIFKTGSGKIDQTFVSATGSIVNFETDPFGVAGYGSTGYTGGGMTIATFVCVATSDGSKTVTLLNENFSEATTYIKIPTLVEPATVIISAYRLGHVRGGDTITIVDVDMAYQAFRGRLTLTETQFLAADVNRDGRITIVDVDMIYQAFRGRLTLQ